jgi:hypothetical protein
MTAYLRTSVWIRFGIVLSVAWAVGVGLYQNKVALRKSDSFTSFPMVSAKKIKRFA